MKKVISFLVITIVIMSSCMQSFACTGFAVYSKEPIYGMNFDFNDLDLKVSIQKSGNVKIFNLYFLMDGNDYLAASMNNSGLLATLQIAPSETENASLQTRNNINIFDIFSKSMPYFSSVKEVSDLIGSKFISPSSGFCIHSLYADKTGNAMIVEAGDSKKSITKIQNKFIVMTNFLVYKFKDKSYNDVEGDGAGRYITASKYISENQNSFNRIQAFDVLNKTIQIWGGGGTQCSMVFDPDKNIVYMALKRDFTKIWKISIIDHTIESFLGFDKPIKMNISTKGILASKLINAKTYILQYLAE